jgi:hypothetical protein
MASRAPGRDVAGFFNLGCMVRLLCAGWDRHEVEFAFLGHIDRVSLVISMTAGEEET